jgi:hypothetical protein
MKIVIPIDRKLIEGKEFGGKWVMPGGSWDTAVLLSRRDWNYPSYRYEQGFRIIVRKT